MSKFTEYYNMKGNGFEPIQITTENEEILDADEQGIASILDQIDDLHGLPPQAKTGLIKFLKSLKHLPVNTAKHLISLIVSHVIDVNDLTKTQGQSASRAGYTEQ